MSQRVVDLLGPWAVRPGALHDRLAGAIREAIERGQLASGSRLPAERALARILSVSRTTVASAYATLQREGLLDSRRGSGTYVRAARPQRVPPQAPARAPRIVRVGGFGTDGAIDLTTACAGTNEVMGEDVVSEALRDPAMRSGHGYSPAGIPSLRAAVAGHLEQAGLPTKPEEVLVTTGAQQAIGLAASLYLRRGDRAALESATFPGAIDVLSASGVRAVPVPMDGDGIRVDALRAAVEEHVARFAYLMPSFQNPTGAVLSAERRRQLALLSAELDLPVVDDMTMHDLWFDRPPPPPVSSYRPDAPIVTIGSASKLFWGGLRIGWLRASEPVVSRIARLKTVEDLGSSVPSQALTAALLRRAPEIGGARRAEAARSAALLGQLLADQLPDWSWEPPRGGLALWVRLPRGDGEELAQVALRHGVVVLPGTLASPERGHGDRLRLPLLREAHVLEEGIARLAAAWRAYEPAAADVRQPEFSVVV